MAKRDRNSRITKPLSRYKKPINTSHAVLHCFYWGHAAIQDLSIMTPIYAALFVLTLLVHSLAEDDELT